MNPEHRRKISEALKAHASRPDSHLRQLHDDLRGEMHPRWKGGINTNYYRRLAFQHYEAICETCGCDESLVVHHRNEDRYDNRVENLQILCRGCHNRHHHRLRVKWTCPVCEESRMMTPSESKARKYCSRECKEKSRGKDGRFHSIQP